MQTHTDTRSPLTRESTARIIRSDAPAKPNARLLQATMPRAADRSAKYRHEHKYEISLFDFLSLTRMLRTIMQPDPHADQDAPQPNMEVLKACYEAVSQSVQQGENAYTMLSLDLHK